MMLRKTLCFALLASIFWIQQTHQYYSYVSTLPNGNNIPCPPNASGCQQSGAYCYGSGHVQADGYTQACDGNPATPVNKFGSDYMNFGNDWNYNYCVADSDSDGKTNGDELGDPCCVWKNDGSVPRSTTNISHPGTNTTRTSSPSCFLEGAPPMMDAPTLNGGTSQITVQWNPSSAHCYCGFFLFKQSGANSNFELVNYFPYSSSSYVDQEIVPQTQYTYFVVAGNLAGNSTGNTATLTTMTAVAPNPGNAPYLVGATESTITLAWVPPKDNGNNITSFSVERNGTVVFSGDATEFSDAGPLTANTLYAYSVSAQNIMGSGNYSAPTFLITNSVGATVVSNYGAPYVISGNKTSIYLGWKQLPSYYEGSTIISYTLQMAIISSVNSTNSANSNVIPSNGVYSSVYTGMNTDFDVTNLSQGVTYSFKVTVTNTIGMNDGAKLQTTTIYCPNDCSNRGICNETTLTCSCNAGFNGTDCSGSLGSALNSTINPSYYTNTVSFTSDFQMYWKINGDQIEIALYAKTTGYVAVGMAPSQSDLGEADMYVGWVDSDGTPYAYDYYDHDFQSIYPDDIPTKPQARAASSGVDSILAFTGAQTADGYTTIVFTRKLNTNDSKDQIIGNGIAQVLWALDDSDPTDEWSVPVHGTTDQDRGWVEINWETGQASTPSISNQLILGHAVLMCVSIVCFGTAMLKRYIQKYLRKNGMYLHYALISMGLVTLLTGLLLGIWAGSATNTTVAGIENGIHAILGYVVVLCAVMIPSLGVIGDHRTGKMEFFPHHLHSILERVVLYGAIGNGALGLKVTNSSDLKFGIFLAVSTFIVIINEIGFVCMNIRRIEEKEVEIPSKNYSDDNVERKNNRMSKPVFCSVTPEIHSTTSNYKNTPSINAIYDQSSKFQSNQSKLHTNQRVKINQQDKYFANSTGSFDTLSNLAPVSLNAKVNPQAAQDEPSIEYEMDSYIDDKDIVPVQITIPSYSSTSQSQNESGYESSTTCGSESTNNRSRTTQEVEDSFNRQIDNILKTVDSGYVPEESTSSMPSFRIVRSPTSPSQTEHSRNRVIGSPSRERGITTPTSRMESIASYSSPNLGRVRRPLPTSPSLGTRPPIPTKVSKPTLQPRHLPSSNSLSSARTVNNQSTPSTSQTSTPITRNRNPIQPSTSNQSVSTGLPPIPPNSRAQRPNRPMTPPDSPPSNRR